MTIWFHKTRNSKKNYCSKSIMINWRPQHWRMIKCFNNGAIKGIHSCYDFNIHFLGIFFSYTNWDYNKKRS